MGKRQTKRQDTKTKTRGFRDLLLGLFAVLCAIYLIACTMPREGRIINNTYVNHVNVSGLDEAEATKRIQKDFEKSYAYQTLTVEAAGQKYTVMINNSLDFDAAAAARKACEFAHGSFLTRGYGVLKAAIFKQRFNINAHIADEADLEKAVKDSGLEEINTTTQTIYNIQGEELIFQKGAVGESVDLPALINRLKEAVQNEDYVSVIESPMKKGTVDPTDMEEIYRVVHTKRKNATLDPKKDYQIVPSSDDVDFDVKAAQEAFDSAKEGSQVAIPLTVNKADVTTEDLRKNLFKTTLGKCSTELSGSDERVANIMLAADKIDGEILLAGESFSFNKTVGERTEERGFHMASSYAGGLTPEETGGGISQVSSALYKSAMLSNLKIDERTNHQYVPEYIDMGMDADVSWEDKDFCFTNNTDYPVRIDAKCSDGNLKVKLKGTKLDENKVKITVKTIQVIEHDTVYRADKSLKRGRNVIMESGMDGYEVQTYRKIYNKNGKRISKKKEAHSTYEAIDAVIAEGTAEPKPKPASKKESSKESSKDSKDTGKDTGGDSGGDTKGDSNSSNP